MMLRLSLRYLRPRTVQLVTQDRIFSSRIPMPGGTNLSRLPPSICVSYIRNRTHVFHADKNAGFRKETTIKVDN